MFCFGLNNINTNAPFFNTHRLEAEVNFPETFKSQLEKNKNVIHRLGGPYWEKLCPRS